jgi:prepilin-type N-terminal cleavage/methylation domain-containing protein
MNLHRQHGFTLWELLMTLLVAGIILGFGVPNVLEFSRNSAMTAAANNLVTATLMARTEAVKRQAPVTLCLSDNPTVATPTCAAGPVFDSATRGYVVFVDENNNFDGDGARALTDATDGNHVIDAGELVLSQTDAPGITTRVHISANCGYITFAPTGFALPLAAPCNPAIAQRSVLFCDDRGVRVAAGSMATARIVRTDRTGRAQALAEPGQFTALIMTGFNAGGANCPIAP